MTQTKRGRPKKKKGNGGTGKNVPKKKPSAAKPAKTRKTLHDIRKEQKKQPKTELGKNGEVVVAASNEGMFFEIEKIVGERVFKGKKQYRVRWKGLPPDGDTWEPIANLCDSAYEDAKRFSRERKALLEASERFFAVEGCSENKENGTPGHATEMRPTPSLQDSRSLEPSSRTTKDIISPGGNEEEEGLRFKEVVRIDVNSKDANKRVADARENGNPMVLVGHGGWAQFARRWLKPPASEKSPGDDSTLDFVRGNVNLDIDELISDLGEELVPVSKIMPNDSKSLEADVLCSVFLTKCWKDNGSSLQNKFCVRRWQFPKSGTAASKLCGEGRSPKFPSEVIGQDLLMSGFESRENPFQYISIGGEGTFTNLESDRSGLDILVTPIFGNQEFVLVHRDDGDDCLYGLNGQLDKVDLHEFPMMSFARIWKTVLRAGEVLLLPQGTFQQSRNVTPCISYSRCHLDILNLPAFLQSLVLGDTPEIEHDKIIWHNAIAFSDQVDKHTENYIADFNKTNGASEFNLPDAAIRSVDTLRTIRHVCREIVMCFNANRRDAFTGDYDGPSKKTIFVKSPHDIHSWKKMVDDIDRILHEFEYRRFPEPPRFRLKRGKSSTAADKDENKKVKTCSSETRMKVNSQPDHALFEKGFEELEDLQPYEFGRRISDVVKLNENDEISLKLHGKRIAGQITKVVDRMQAFYLSYDDLPSCHDEFQPKECIQGLDLSLDDETQIKLRAHLPSFCNGDDADGDLKVSIAYSGDCEVSPSFLAANGNSVMIGDKVQCYPGGYGELSNATVKSSKTATFYLVRLHFNDFTCDRWFRRDVILQKID